MTETLEGMTGLERLRELAGDIEGVTLWSVLKIGCEKKWDAATRSFGEELREIAGMIERERAELIGDNQARIDADALKRACDYWGCGNIDCSLCPAKVGGKAPHERYGTGGDCANAKTLDLLRRQRELDAREGA